MSVKNKVKRLNKRIVELEKEIERIKSESIPLNQIFMQQEIDKTREYKDNFIKMILNERKGIEHNCCKFRISRGQLETMKNARLEVERSWEYPDSIDFKLKV